MGSLWDLTGFSLDDMAGWRSNPSQRNHVTHETYGGKSVWSRSLPGLQIEFYDSEQNQKRQEWVTQNIPESRDVFLLCVSAPAIPIPSR